LQECLVQSEPALDVLLKKGKHGDEEVLDR
jgi:hypothetical protein